MPNRETMNVSLSPEFKAFVKALVASGRYRNDSEVVRDALRMLQEKERWRRLEEDLLEGLHSGSAGELDEAAIRSLQDEIRRRAESRKKRA